MKKEYKSPEVTTCRVEVECVICAGSPGIGKGDTDTMNAPTSPYIEDDEDEEY